MSPRKRKSSQTETIDYRHDDTRKNIPRRDWPPRVKSAKFLEPDTSTTRTCLNC
ncbi:hypothetical protein ACFLV7_16130 [Chloroflexota bacterium]